jgi:N6-adenosine-specific RNA methylase IME4/ParB-like chromosome segregation protein Spo0J
MSVYAKSRDVEARLLETAERDGFVIDATAAERKACIRLNVAGLLKRDPKQASKWYSKKEPASIQQNAELQLPEGQRLPHHALAGIFPMFSETEIEELADDIRQRGQEQPIWLLDGKIIDGRNRDEACHRAGLSPKVRTYTGDDPLGFVLSLNLRRRHLTESQRAMVAAKIVDWERGMNQSTSGSANLPTREAARRLSISERAVVAAKRIRDQGAPALQQAIETGKISVNAGEALSYLEKQAQEEALRAENKAIIAKAKEIRTDRQRHARLVRTTVINAIADRGRMVTGEMPVAVAPVGYCDCPWQQEAWSDETGQDKGLPYPSMTVAELMALCAGEKSPFTRDAVLYFWSTTNRLRDAMAIIEAWGFRFVSMITWDKVHIGMGRWVRDRTEHLLICKRGDFPGIDLYTPKPESLYSEPKSEHSRKPVWFAEEIERLYPTMRKLELFQRKDSLADGDVRLNGSWIFWGNQAGEPESEVLA